jgi:hypothetical protein
MTMQHTLAFAPTEEDLQDFYFDLPVIMQGPGPEPAAVDPAEPDAEQDA